MKKIDPYAHKMSKMYVDAQGSLNEDERLEYHFILKVWRIYTAVILISSIFILIYKTKP